MTALLWDSYEFQELKSIRDVKESFPAGEADHLNWLFIGTSGRHGTYRTLDQVENIIRGKDDVTKPLENGKYFATVLIIHPRLCIVKYGEIPVGLPDVALLRKLVSSTLAAIEKSQDGNT